MKKITFLLSAILICLACFSQKTDKNFSSFEQAKKHPIIHEGPAPDFFEGALIGNGGLGAVVCTRPDAVMIRFGHNSVWDIRIAEDYKEELGTFQEVFDKVKAIDPNLKSLNQDPWFAEYMSMARANYAKPYPRPFPCGSLILGFDRRKVELIEHKLDISNGLVSIKLLLNKKNYAFLEVFTDMEKDRVWMKLVDEDGKPITNCFNRIRLIPDTTTPKEFPKYEVQDINKGISFKQVMPYLEPDEYDIEKGYEKDKAFSLSVVLNNKIEKKQRIDWNGNTIDMADMEYSTNQDQSFWLCAELREGDAGNFDVDFSELEALQTNDFENTFSKNDKIWTDYWNKSGVVLEDKFLESIWYRNLYFFNCAAKSGVRCPGLFANWSFNNIGTAWHGDYHMNYNTQQPFWVTFSSNHLEKNLPYVEMIEFISGVAKKWAEEYYGMRGAYYPHSAYPVDMTMNPYPVPTWGWEICETPWSVQGVWWQYLYSGDKDFLKSRVFPLIKDATLFIVDYMTRPEAHGPQWNDNNYHVFPTVPPELYGLRPGFKFNSDCLVDLTLIKFLFKSYLSSVEILGYKKNEKATIAKVNEILNNYPDYPIEKSNEYGKVFVSVVGESTETVYNVPNSLMTVFPGEDHGLHSDEETLRILKNTRNNTQIEGGNELVFQHLQAARIGMLDIGAFKREINYNLLSNGTTSLNVLQINGRYSDHTNSYFMANMGIWFENFALPAVINECMLQSYNGIVRLFPNWPDNKSAEFKTLRAVGGFLVSSSMIDGKIRKITVKSENDNQLKLYNPWGSESKVKVIRTNGAAKNIGGDVVKIDMKKGEVITLERTI
ncbi:glycoside hydrolase N-terminal domain-containing protein [Draconibacterium sp.]|nr:glycoside hydrolase N-terminal domain-containing protein [Draconibacterium sp.]